MGVYWDKDERDWRRSAGTNPAAYELKANKGIAGGYASLDAGGKVPAAQLGSGSASAGTALLGSRQWHDVRYFGPDIQTADGTFTHRTAVYLHGPGVLVQDNSTAGRTDIYVGTESALPPRQSLDPTALPGVVSRWKPTDALIGESVLADQYENHDLTLAADYEFAGRPWQSSEDLVWLYPSGEFDGISDFISEARDASCYWIGWIESSPYVVSSPAVARALFHVGGDVTLDTSATNTLFYISITNDNRVRVFWEHDSGVNVEEFTAYLRPGARHLLCVAREHGATSTLIVWLDGVRVTTVTGLTNPSGGSSAEANLLTTSRSADDGAGIRVSDAVWGSGAVPTDAEVLAQYLRGEPDPGTGTGGTSGGLGDAATLDGYDSSAFELVSRKNTANGYAGLDGDGLIPAELLPETGGGGDADTLDGLDSTSFVRSDSAAVLSGVLTPSTISSSQDNYNPTGLASANCLRLAASSAVELRGLAGGAAGRLMLVHNVGSYAITLKNAAGTSTAANRFDLAADIALDPSALVVLQYDAVSSRWRAVAGGGGGGGGGTVGPSDVVFSTTGVLLGRISPSGGAGEEIGALDGRDLLGLGSAATADVGNSAGEVAAGDHTHDGIAVYGTEIGGNMIVGWPDITAQAGNLWGWTYETGITPTASTCTTESLTRTGSEEVVKLVTSGSGSGKKWTQQLNVADHPYLAVGAAVSCAAMVYQESGGATITLEMEFSGGTSYTATTITNAAFTSLKIENKTVPSGTTWVKYSLYISANSKTFYAQDFTFNRGTVAQSFRPNRHYTVLVENTNFVNVDPADTNWHDIDFSSVTHPLCFAVHAETHVNAGAAAGGPYVMGRAKYSLIDSTLGQIIAKHSGTAGVSDYQQVRLDVDSDQVAQYKASNANITQFQLHVRSYERYEN